MSLNIQTPDVAAALQRLFGIKGDIRPTLAREIIATVSVGDVAQEGPPAPKRAATASALPLGVAGQLGTFSLDMPPGSLAVITRLHVRPASDMFVFADFDSLATAPGAVADEAFTDPRLLEGTGNTPFGQVLFGTQVAAIATPWRAFALAAGGLTLVNPGWIAFNPVGGTGTRSILFQGAGTNTALPFTLEWDEYSLVGD